MSTRTRGVPDAANNKLTLALQFQLAWVLMDIPRHGPHYPFLMIMTCGHCLGWDILDLLVPVCHYTLLLQALGDGSLSP
ncbi:hypothetical protein TNCT_421781 [Trichonephila clavata]|uniref:Uncharacterized protein n=1 Tax=Trichonephila clavata TaxID=2740835 RepID=A0A8X6HF56_TRICU|nr:hypothetical protein TNCT_421781 [Trichonephila clavata]